MNRERLGKLAYLMRNLKTEFPQMGGFDLGCWVAGGSCGTVACACGWAGMWKPFQDEGFRIGDVYKEPEFDGWTEFEAVNTFFGLSSDESSWLFLNSYYLGQKYNFVKVSPEQVAFRIEALLNGTANVKDRTFGLV